MDEKGRAAQVDTLWDRALAGSVGNTWHWLTFNFTRGTEGSRYFTPLTLNALAQVDEAMPGYAESMLARLEQINGREKNMQDYNAILQWLAELLVIHHLVQHPWPSSFSFQMEPTATGSKKNPEMVVTLDGVGALGVEVKCPNLDSHRRARSTNTWQLNARNVMSPRELNGGVTLPRDNPMKDFLISSDAKFAGFRAQNADFASVLLVVWDDFINEPLSALLAPSSGLLTPASFHLDGDGQRVPYPNVDGVVVIRHQHQFAEGMANRPPVDERRHFLDYGELNDFPPHALVPNPDGKALRQEWVDALGAWDIPALRTAGAEYHPGEMVMWIDG